MNLLCQTSQPSSVSLSGVRFLDNSLWQWLALLGVVIVSVVVGRIVSTILSRQGRLAAGRRWAQLLHKALQCLATPAAAVIFAAGLYAGSLFMTFSSFEGFDIRTFWHAVCKTIVALAVGWAAYRLVEVLEELLRPWAEKADAHVNLLPLVRKAVRVFILVVLGLFIVQNIFRWEIGPLLAGLGLGGLAVALAAQDALKNFFGSIAVLTDQPFRIGERIQMEGVDGWVDEIGFRSTRIRSLTGPVVSVPNSKLADATIVNVSRQPFLARNLSVTVTYSTSPEKMERAVAILREMLEARKASFHPDRPPRVFFSDFASESLVLLVQYWFVPVDWWPFCEFNHDFHMELLRRFNEERIEFAFPTRTLYLKQDSPLSADVRVKMAEGADGASSK